MRWLVAGIIGLAAGGAAVYALYEIPDVNAVALKLADDSGIEPWMIIIAAGLFFGGAVCGIVRKLTAPR